MVTRWRGRPALVLLAAVVLGLVLLIVAALLTTREAAAPTPEPTSTAGVTQTPAATATATATAQVVTDPDARYAVTTAMLRALDVLYMTSARGDRLEIMVLDPDTVQGLLDAAGVVLPSGVDLVRAGSLATPDAP